MITIKTLSSLAYFTYIFIDIFLYFGKHVMVFWNLLDGGPNRNGLLIGPSESLRDGIPDTNPRQHPRVFGK
jgi:hypothetical protein